MREVTPRPEKVIEKTQQELEAQQEASVKVAKARDAAPGTLPAEGSSENEKLKLAAIGRSEGNRDESRILRAGEYGEPKKPLNYEYANRVFSFDRNVNPELYDRHPEKARLYAGLERKYPEGVRFDADGYPDFTRYAIKTVKIDMNGNYSTDPIEANRKAGLEDKPKGYTWHHHQDGTTMQLVPTDLHRAVRHTGGVSMIKHERE